MSRELRILAICPCCGIHGLHPTVDHCLRGLRIVLAIEKRKGHGEVKRRAARRRRIVALFATSDPPGKVWRPEPHHPLQSECLTRRSRRWQTIRENATRIAAQMMKAKYEG